MKQLLILPLVAGVLVTGCAPKPGAEKNLAIDPSNMDTTVACGEDFYEYACGGWIKKNPLKPEYARYGSFDVLAENNQKQMRELIDELEKAENEPGSVAQKVGDLYKMGLDSVRLNKEGVSPISEALKNIASLDDKAAFASLVAQMHKEGSSPFFQLYVGADEKNSSMNIVNLYQGGMSMGDRDYYLSEDSANVKIRDAYKKYINKLFTLAGYSAEKAVAAEKNVMNIETALAKVAFSREETRNPLKNYNKMPMTDFLKQMNGFDWKSYFSALGLDSLNEINPNQLPFIKGMDALVGGLTSEEIRDYLIFKQINTASSYLSDDFVQARFDFYGKVLSGQQELKPRWKRSLSVTDGALGEALGEMYVAKYFPPEAKERMLKLVENLRISLGEHIDSLEWMSAETKAKAKEKLAAFYVKIGYPDKWRDYSGLTIDPKKSYWDNVREAAIFESDYMLSDVNKPVDKTRWLMSPQTVNAYYNPTTNEICFPAGILQPPFFYMDADDAVNYGGIGVVIGHEMTHGFDDQGRQYDKDGNLKDWWTAEDAKQFNLRADKLADQYSSIIVLDTVHANGRFTLGENIADHGGLRVSYTAFKNATKGQDLKPIDGFTPDQRFYLAYAGLWAQNIRDEEILRLTKIDPHSLGKWRVNAALRNLESFFQAFGITEKDPMYMKPEDRVTIW
ncbi:M13 family metallopeptidase [Coprobacter fastidiosus]|uniref:Putative endopeptidase n=1 Tax=Coprobacter fastidiosus NSB1 = JCM 33896 TaxID=1349822 RepID=A0A495WKJ5_9BACT|nr:M13 family metallopeptidase [Coprobacter fastidiosus]RKT61235.1 putative endopeptidase [Coprobacter fastidiosus NSB1 = JCM 33896]